MEPDRTTWRFFLLAYVITSLALLAPLLARYGVIDGAPDDYLAGAPIAIFGPALAAVIVRYREGGLAAVRALLLGLRAFRVHGVYYVLALALPTLTYVVGRAVYALVGGEDGGPYLWPPADAQHVVAALLVPIGEEIGWRGHALPRLIERHGPLSASLRLGVLWAGWHVPMLLIAGDQPAVLAMMVPYFLAGSVMFTWLYRRTQGSLLLAILLHVGAHLCNPGQAEPGDLVPMAIATCSYVALAVLLVALDRSAFPFAREVRRT